MSEKMSEKMNEKKLKNCPFCGGEAITHSRCSYEETGGETMFFARCKHCGVEGPWSYSKENAINAWNTRVPMQKIVERLEEDSKHWWKMKQEALKLNEGDLVNRYDAFEIASNNAIDIVKEEGGLNE
jgi:Lar family restriction alleviation protein